MASALLKSLCDEDLEVLKCLNELKYMHFPKDEFYIVDRITEHKYIKGHLMFLTYWLGYSDKDATWEPRDSFKIEGSRSKYIDIFSTYCKINGISL